MNLITDIKHKNILRKKLINLPKVIHKHKHIHNSKDIKSKENNLHSFYVSITTMFAKFKSANQANISPFENNPITQFFEVGKLTACAGPELVWKIHESFRKSDGKVSS